MPEATLEEMAQALARGQRQLEEAKALADELRGPYELAEGRVHDLMSALDLIEHEMETAKRRHLIERAVTEMGLSSPGPPVVIVGESSRWHRANRYELVAIGPEGSALYLHTPEHSHRYGGKTYARLRRDGEQPLFEWEERGRGQYGAGSGSVKPKAPPEGGRWRWLKVREQEMLPAGGDDA